MKNQKLSFNKHLICRLQMLSIWTRLKVYLFTTQSRLQTTLKKKPFENTQGKGEHAGYQHFLLFLQCFQSIQKRISASNLHLFCLLQIL